MIKRIATNTIVPFVVFLLMFSLSIFIRKEVNIRTKPAISANKALLIEIIVKHTKAQKEIINGALLGDGCLTKPKHGENCIFCYLSKSKQHVEFVCNDFIKYSIQNGIVYNSFFDERTNTIKFNLCNY